MSSTPRVRLTGCKAGHAAAWHRFRAEDASRRYNPLFDATVAELARRLRRVSSDVSDQTRTDFRWMVVLEGSADDGGVGDGEVVGTVSLAEVSWQCGYGTVGIMIGEAHQNRGVGRAALAALIGEVFAKSSLRRLMATVSVDNERSRRLFEHTGFTLEGTLREHFWILDRAVDQLVFGLLEREWEARAGRGAHGVRSPANPADVPGAEG